MPGPRADASALSTPCRLEAEDLVHEDDGDPAGLNFTVHNQELVHAALDAVRGAGSGIFEREGEEPFEVTGTRRRQERIDHGPLPVEVDVRHGRAELEGGGCTSYQ